MPITWKCYKCPNARWAIPLQGLEKGMPVVLHGLLCQTGYNGQFGTLREFDKDRNPQRWEVEMRTGEIVWVEPNCMFAYGLIERAYVQTISNHQKMIEESPFYLDAKAVAWLLSKWENRDLSWVFSQLYDEEITAMVALILNKRLHIRPEEPWVTQIAQHIIGQTQRKFGCLITNIETDCVESNDIVLYRDRKGRAVAVSSVGKSPEEAAIYGLKCRKYHCGLLSEFIGHF